jgi:NAD(P)-dependent dehydrogenase (short-subunit alcohol dehydrogenase family)
MAGICEGRVAIVTGAGAGLGREHALELARQGAKVVVNDIGVALDGSGGSGGPAQRVVEEIEALGGEAVADMNDVADWDASAALVKTAIDTFGDLHAVVNNAGIVRDRMFTNAEPDEFDAVIRVHLRGHFCVGRHAARHWRDQSKAGAKPSGRIINTSSGAGLQGSIAQAVYSAAKAGIAAMTLVQAAELGRYGVTANALAPSARTRMTEDAFADMMKKPESGFDAMDPANVSPLVAWLASEDSSDASGQVFEVEGGKIGICDGWRSGPQVDQGARWDPRDIGPAVRDLLAKAVPAQKVHGT